MGTETVDMVENDCTWEELTRRAKSGDVPSQMALVKCYSEGINVEKDQRRATEWCHKAAKAGNAEAQYQYGDRWFHGNGLERNWAKAVWWFRKAAKQGHTKAAVALGNCYRAGMGVGRDVCTAGSWYENAYDAGYTSAATVIGEVEEEQDSYARAAHWYRVAAKQGDVDGKYRLARLLKQGRGVTQDNKEALRLFVEAADAGKRSAQFELGLAYATGEGVEQNSTAAVRLWEEALREGPQETGWDEGAAHLQLGLALARGEGTPLDIKRAHCHLVQAAVWNWDPSAMYHLALFLLQAFDHRQEGIRWLRRAARQSADAQMLLARLYTEGKQVTQNLWQAARLWTLAAESGCAEAEFRLGRAYLLGAGVQSDGREALRLLSRAVQHGYAAASEYIKPFETTDEYQFESWCEMLAGTGDLEVQYQLAQAYTGDTPCLVQNARASVPFNTQKAKRWAFEAAQGHHAEAQYLLATLCQSDEHPGAKQHRYAWLVSAASNGHKAAQSELGDMFEAGEGVPVNIDSAIQWWKRAATWYNGRVGNYSESCPEFKLLLYCDGEEVVGRCRTECMEYWRERAESGDAAAQLRYYLVGPKQKNDDWLQKAVEQGLPDAHHYVGDMLYRRARYRTVAPEKKVIGLQHLKQAAEHAHTEAQYKLSRSYCFGLLSSKDTVVASEWLNRAAQNSNPEACERLADSYRLSGDWVKAVLWYEKALALGEVRAKLGLIECYEHGCWGTDFGPEVDKAVLLEEAAECGCIGTLAALSLIDVLEKRPEYAAVQRSWLHLLAEQYEWTSAQLELGKRYLFGTKMRTDKQRAAHYLRLAAARSTSEESKEAKSLLQSIQEPK